MSHILAGSSTALWQELILQGAERAHLALGEEIESYLVFTLARHAGDARLGARVMALEWLQAQEPPRRPDALRDVGDRCLLIAGLFPKLAARRRLNTRYYIDLGRSAYASAADRAPRCERGLFAHLAEAFLSMVGVLTAVRPEPLLAGLCEPAKLAAPGRHLH